MTKQRRSARGGRTEPARAEPAPRDELGTLTIESIAAGGDGVGRLHGMACFVPRTAPGDVAQVAVRRHARHARGRVLQLLHASDERTVPACSHYVEDRCGGCQLQHLTEPAQQQARVRIVADAMRRIGRRDVEPPTLLTGPQWHYRGRLTLTLHRRGSGWIGGLHPHDDAARVFALRECPISDPVLVAAWHALQPGLPGLPVVPVLRLGFRRSDDDGRVALVVQGGATWPEARQWAERARRAHAPLHAVLWEDADGVRRVLAGDAVPADGETLPSAPRSASSPAPRRGGANVATNVDDLAPEAAEALAFAQVNRIVAAALREHVLERILDFEPARVVDGYAGVGLLTEALAALGVAVVAIEADPAATARIRGRVADRPDVSVVTGVVESALASSLPADVIVLNPPRRGVDEQVTTLLSGAAARGVHAVVYVSCDPATLARDVARLPGWRVATLRCFDMFPQTAHVETVCVLVPEVP